MDQIKELLNQCKTKAEQVNTLRKYEESERHWYCRKSFLLKNWDDFDESDRHMLECLSTCWANLHFLGSNYPYQVIDKVREMSYGLPNMSEMLTYADQEVKDLAAERRIKRRADFEKKSNTGGPPTKMQKTEENRLDSGRHPAPKAPQETRKIDPKDLPPPLRPSAKQIGLFLKLSSGVKKQNLSLIDSIKAANSKISILTEEVGSHNVEKMRQFYKKPELSESDVVVEVNVMGVFVSQAVGSRTEARAAAEETAYNILKQPVVVVVTSHREKFNGKIVSELCVSNSRGAKPLGTIAPKLRSPEIRVEPI